VTLVDARNLLKKNCPDYLLHAHLRGRGRIPFRTEPKRYVLQPRARLCGWVRVTADRPLRSEQQQRAGSRGRPRGVVHLYEPRNFIPVRFKREDNDALPLFLLLSLFGLVIPLRSQL